jgi:hypothetical protein
MVFESGAYYVMDRGYLDFSRLYKIHLAGSYFVTRLKHNTLFRRLYSARVTDEEKKQGIRCDQTIVLTGQKSKTDYREKLRRIKYYDAEKSSVLRFSHEQFLLTSTYNCFPVSTTLVGGAFL